MERGWGVYVGVVLVFIIASMLTTAIPIWLNFVLKTRTKLRWKWYVTHVAHLMATV